MTQRYHQMTSLCLSSFIWLGCQPQKKLIDSPEERAPLPTQQEGEANPQSVPEPSSEAVEGEIESHDDAASLPQPISGAYLYCSDDHNGLSLQDPRSHSIRCALQQKDAQVPVPLYSLDYQLAWQLEGLEPDLMNQAIYHPMPQHKQWHYEISFRSLKQIEINSLRSLATVTLSLQKVDSRSVIAEATSMIRSHAYAWVPLNGGTLPANRIKAGTEQQGAVELSLCRIHYQGGIFPGKLRNHFADPAKSICYTAVDELTLESQERDPNVNVYRNDVLLLEDPNLAARVQWRAASNGELPPGAFEGGKDPSGQAIYICRNREGRAAGDSAVASNDPNGEWTPGYLKAGESVCRHEFYGSATSTQYEVLVIAF